MALMRVELPLNVETEIHYVVPRDPVTGEIPASASNILFWAPFLGTAPQLRAGGLGAAALEYARRGGWTVFSMTIDSILVDGSEKEFHYWERDLGWDRAVFAAQEWLQRQYGLKPGKLLLGGESAGGSMAERLAVTHPERVLAAAWSGGSTYLPIPEGFPVPMMALNSWGCGGTAATRELQRQASAEGVQLLWEEVPPYLDGRRVEHHAPSRLTEKRKWLFLQGIVDLQDPGTGEVPTPAEWPESLLLPDGTTAHFPNRELREEWERIPLVVNHALRQEDFLSVLPGPAPETRRMQALLFYEALGRCFLQDAAESFRSQDAESRMLFCGGVGFREQDVFDDVEGRVDAALAALPAVPAEEASSLPLLILGNGQGAHHAIRAARRLLESDVRRPLYLCLLDPCLRLDEEEQLLGKECVVRVFFTRETLSALSEKDAVFLPSHEDAELQWLDFLRISLNLPLEP